MRATSTSKRTGSKLAALILAASVAGLGGCAAEEGDVDNGNDKADLSNIPTEELKMLARVGSQDQLETLFHASAVDSSSTIGMVMDELTENNATSLRIKGEGIPIFTNLVDGVDLHLGGAMSSIARAIWTGKVFTFRLQEDGSIQAELENAILGAEFINAQIYISNMADAMKGRGEDDPGEDMDKLGFFEGRVEVDNKLSVMLDYELERISLFSSLIDELRPVSEATLAEAGIEIPDSVGNIEDLWIGRATAIFGIFRPERKFVLYFAVHFDRNTMEFDVAE